MNRAPFTTREGKLEIPYELFWNKKSSLKRLVAFGAVGYAKRNRAKQKKLDPRGEKCQFIGYSTYPPAYVVLFHDRVISTTRTFRPLYSRGVVTQERVPQNSGTEKMEKELRKHDKPIGESIIQTRAQKRREENLKKQLEKEIFNLEALVPRHFFDIKNFENKQDWYDSYFSEIESLEKIGNLRVIKEPEGVEILPILELFNYKYDPFNEVMKTKVRIVVRGDKKNYRKRKYSFTSTWNGNNESNDYFMLCLRMAYKTIGH